MTNLAKNLIIIGSLILITGLAFYALEKVPFAGKLKGDFLVIKKHFTFYFPLTTFLLVSIIMTILLNIFKK